jgi:hypothetical protein
MQKLSKKDRIRQAAELSRKEMLDETKGRPDIHTHTHTHTLTFTHIHILTYIH